MIICIISNLYKPYVLGGAEIYVSKIVKYLTQRKENKIILITTRPFKNFKSLFPTEEIINKKLKIYRFFPLNLYHSFNVNKKSIYIRPVWHILDLWNIHSYFVIKKILKNEKPDIIHTHNIAGFSTSVFTAISKFEKPHLHTLHDYQLLSPWAMLFRNEQIIKKFNFFEKLFYKIKRRFARMITIILSPSQFVIDIHKRYEFFKNSICIHLPLGIELDSNPTKKDAKNINIVYFGQLVQHKGVDVLLKSFSEIKNNNIKLHIAGAGPLLETLKKTYKNDLRIIFYGFITGKEKINLWQKADIAVIPSIWYENSPVTVYEAFKNKTALIVSAIGGIKELVNDKNGLLFRVGDRNDLKEKLQLLISNKQLRNNLAKNAYEDYINYYTIEKHIKKLIEIYQNAKS